MPLVAERPSLTDRVVAAPRQVRTVVAVYRRTPARLRRPEPALRLGVAATGAWFGALFALLAVATSRAATVDRVITVAFAAAALLGPTGVALFLTRRPRPGLSALGAMLVLGQAGAVLAVLRHG